VDVLPLGSGRAIAPLSLSLAREGQGEGGKPTAKRNALIVREYRAVKPAPQGVQAEWVTVRLDARPRFRRGRLVAGMVT